MNRLLLARIALTFTGIVVWGYGQRYDLPSTRLAGMAIMIVALALRFVPKKVTGTDNTVERERDERDS